MSDVMCLACGHGPHTNKQCGLCRCQTFVNAALALSRSSVTINNILAEKIPVFEGMVFNLLEIVAEAFPEAVARVDARREERRQQLEQETQASQQSGFEADQTGENAGSGGSDGSADSGVS